MSLGSAFETKFSTSARYGAVLNLVRRTAVGPTKFSAAQLVDADDEHQNKNKHLGTAEACSARERPGWGGRWCGLNDRTLMFMSKRPLFVTFADSDVFAAKVCLLLP